MYLIVMTYAYVLYRNTMIQRSQDIWDGQRRLTSVIEETIGRKCVRMLIGKFGNAMIASGPKVQHIQPLGFFGLYLNWMNHGKIIRWILSYDYQGAEGLMQYG